MIKYLKSVFMVLLLIMMSTLALSQQVLDRVVAIVDDDIILESEVVQSAYLAALQMGIDPAKNAQEFQNLKEQVFNTLINKKVLLIQADKDTVEADERTVEFHLQQQMQQVAQQVGGEDKIEEYFGMSPVRVRKNYREQIEEELRITAVRDLKMTGITVSRREIESFYTTHKDSLPEIKATVELSHILIKPEPGPEAVVEAKNEIEMIQQKLNEGADFSELAKQYSDDPGSAPRGGDLGFMSRGTFVREFESAAFELEPGQVSDIVRTEFGFHIIKLLERRGEKIHAQHILAAPEPSEDDQVLAAEKIKDIHSQLINGADFSEMVTKYSQDETTIANAGQLGQFEIDQLRQTAKEFVWALENIDEGDYSDPVKTQYGYHVLLLQKRQRPRSLDLQKDWERIKQMALENKKQQEFQKWVNEIKNEVYVEIKDVEFI